MELEYLVLRIEDEAPAPRLGAPRAGFDLQGLRGFTLGPGADRLILDSLRAEPPPKKVTVESHLLSAKQSAEARRDPKNLLALSMPMSLIAPRAIGTGEDDPLSKARADGHGWGLAAIGALDTPCTGKDMVVAVLDSGIDRRHAAFLGVEWTARNFTRSPEDDAIGHGTHCAGVIFGRAVDGVRIGVAQGVTRALDGKVCDDDGRCSSKTLLDALDWARREGAHIVSMSLGFDFARLEEVLRKDHGLPMQISVPMALTAYRENLDAFRKLMDLMHEQSSLLDGMTIVSAAGNESLREKDPDYVVPVSLPGAAHPMAISVGALAPAVGGKYRIAPFSNIGPTLCGPGVGVVSAKAGGGLVAMDGTSMACPHVAGLAALWRQAAIAAGSTDPSRDARDRMKGACARNLLDAGVTPEDRGAGLAQAPRAEA